MNDTERLTSLRDAIDAHLAGKPVQAKALDYEIWSDQPNPDFLRFASRLDFRPKPEAKTRPWTADDVPSLCWLRHKDGWNVQLVTYVYSEAVRVHDGPIKYDNLADKWLHSTDRKTWLPCVEVTE